MEIFAAALYGAHDLVHVGSFKRSIPLANLHLRCTGRKRERNYGRGSTNTNGCRHKCPSAKNTRGGDEMEKCRKNTSSSPTSPRRLARFSRRVWRGYWQVFGLAGVAGQTDRSFYWPIFPVLEKTDRKSTRLNSSHQIISYAVFCLKKKNQHHNN